VEQQAFPGSSAVSPVLQSNAARELGPTHGSGCCPMKPTIVVATVLRPEGETGVQSHFNTLLTQLGDQVDAARVTPFDAPAVLAYPVFAIRKLVDPVSGSASVWWYRYWHYVFLKLALRSKLRRIGDAVVYAQCPLSAKAALEVRPHTRIRVVAVVHFNISQADEWAEKGRIPHGGTVFRRIRKLEERVLPQVDGLVFVSQFMRQELQRRIPALCAVPSVVVPNFVSDPGPRITNSAEIVADLITVGTLEPRKNQSFLIRVLAECASLGKRYSLSVVGDGPDRGRLEKLAAELGVSEQVRFLGFRRDVSKLMGAHRAYCHAATVENMPLTLIEALSNGLPILAAPTGGIPEVFSDEVEGLYWPLDDASAASQKLISLLGSEERLLAMSSAARLRFEGGFEAKRVAAKTLNFLRHFAAGDVRDDVKKSFVT